MSELTPEERDRIYQEEKARHDAQEQIKTEDEAKKKVIAQKKTREGLLGCFGVLVAVLALWGIYEMAGGSGESPTPQRPALRIGQDYRLAAPGSDKELLLGVTKGDADEITSAFLAKDMARISGLIRTGKAFSVNTQTQVKFVESTLAYVRVSIQEGDMSGRTGWLPREYVK